MNRRLGITCIAATLLCPPAYTAAQELATQTQWTTAVRMKIARGLRPPKALRDGDGPLRLQIMLVVLRNGEIESATLSKPSGNDEVDQATLAMVRRVGRLPAFTPDMQGDKHNLALPVTFQTDNDAPRRPLPPPRQITDAATGFSLTLTEPFQVSGKRSTPRYDVLFEVGSTTGTPPLAAGGKFLCSVGFKAASPGAQRTQAALNTASAVNARVAEIKRSLGARLPTLEDIGEFDLRGMKGIEYVSAPSTGAGSNDIQQYTAQLDNPAGRITLACATQQGAMQDARPVFRTILNGASVTQR